MVLATLAQGVLPTSIAWFARAIVDGVVTALRGGDAAWRAEADALLELVAIEASLAIALLVAQRVQTTAQLLFRERLSNEVTQKVLGKAISLELAQLEDPEVHDQML